MKYTAKNHELLKVENRIGQWCAVNNIEQVVEPESSPQSGVTMLNNIVDKIEQCGKNNIVQSCFQEPSTTGDFFAVYNFPPISSTTIPADWHQKAGSRPFMKIFTSYLFHPRLMIENLKL